MKFNFKQLISLCLALVLCLSFCACGSTGVLGGNSKTPYHVGRTDWYMGGHKMVGENMDPEAYFSNVPATIDPAQIYANTQFTEQMLHGCYTLNNREKDVDTVREQIPFEDVTFKSGTNSLTILPTAVYFGSEYINNSLTHYSYTEFEDVADGEVAVLELATADRIGQTICIYEINGNQIIFKQIEQTSQDNEPFAYGYTGVEFAYEFSLCGPYLTFSRNGHSLRLMAYCFTENCDDELWLSGYSLPDSPLVDALDYFSSSDIFNYAVTKYGGYYSQSAFAFGGDGLFKIYLSDMDENFELNEYVGQYAYIIQSNAGILTYFNLVLLDAEKAYYYTDDITQREARALKEQGVDVDSMSEDEIKQIAEKKADLFDDLYDAFQEQGINATINRSTGEIALDATVLFGVAQSEISEEGKAFLQQFMSVYTSVVFGDKYADFVSKIMVEGHTDTDGSYELNKQLSQDRADSVKAYCLSADCGVDAQYAESLQTMLEAVGYSYDKPVYGADGQVDMDASRRVSFRFVINVG